MEFRHHAAAIHALGRGGESQQNFRLEFLREHTVARGFGAVRFVNDDDFVKIFPELFEKLPVLQHADRAEEMVETTWLVIADQ